jgi:hypothetical protein
LAHPGVKTVSLNDIELIDPDRLKRMTYITRLTNVKAVKNKEDRSTVTAVSFKMGRYNN